MASNANEYVIYHIDRDGKFDAKLDDTDGRAKCLITLADIVRAILKTDKVNSALVRRATEYCDHNPAAWFLQEGQGSREERIKDVVREFLDRFQGRRGFPTLCISDRLRHADVTGVVHRYQWEGPFLLSSERMLLNGVRLQKILDLETESVPSGHKQGDILNACRIIKFQFVVTIFHEIGHIFFTYLAKGTVDTPQTQPNQPAEFGYRFEELVFGGAVQFLRDLRLGHSNFGVPTVWLKKEKQDGNEKPKIWYFEVTKEAINRTLDIKFQLPFKEDLIVHHKLKDLRTQLKKMEPREEEEGESADPALHPEWDERLQRIDPEGYERLKETYPEGVKKAKKPAGTNESAHKAVGSKLWLQDLHG